MMIKSKALLLAFISNLSDEQCDAVFERLTAKAQAFNSLMLANSDVPFDESKHPRGEDGRWTNGAPGHLTKKESEKWARIGRSNPDPRRFPDLLKKIQKRENGAKWTNPEAAKKSEAELVAWKRELSEKMRQYKHDQRVKLESKASKRYMDKLVKEYRDIDDDIDYLEETYADRESGSLTKLKFPSTKKGQRDKAKYEKLVARRDELMVDIDWDLVDD